MFNMYISRTRFKAISGSFPLVTIIYSEVKRGLDVLGTFGTKVRPFRSDVEASAPLKVLNAEIARVLRQNSSKFNTSRVKNVFLARLQGHFLRKNKKLPMPAPSKH